MSNITLESLIQELIDSGRNKIKILYYNRTYPINPDQDFYLEDMFDRRVYNVVQFNKWGAYLCSIKKRSHISQEC